MLTKQQDANRRPNRRDHLILGLTALGLMLAAVRGHSQNQPIQPNQQYQQYQQNQQNATPNPQVRRPVATTTTPAVQTPAVRGQQPVNGANRTPAINATTNSNQTRPNLPNLFAPPNGTDSSSAASRPAATNSGQTQTLRNPAANFTQRQRQTQPQPQLQPNNVTTPNTPRSSTNGVQLAKLNATHGPTSTGRPVQSRAFLGYPGPAGSTEAQTRNGNTVRTAADGSILDVRSPRNGMFIHHGLDGSRRIMVDRPDHSRVFASSRGVQYVQHPYVFRGRAYDHRTFLVHGQVFHQFYRPYTYAGTTLDVYAPPRYYAPNMYEWVTSRSNTPQSYTWPYASNPPPWFGHYRSYFTPDSAYSSPLSWLADYVLAASLVAAYKTESSGSQPAPADAPAAVTPEVKQMLADEVGRQVRQESVEAQENAQNRDPQPGAGGVVQELSDKQPHVFVVASDLDLVDPTGRRCMVSEGDVVQVVSEPKSDTSAVDAVVMASKGGVECERSAHVEIALNEVQEMQNHMRETIDQGMAETNAGKQAAKVTPAFAASAPPPDSNAAREIDQQQLIAAAAES
jgi:hypothetical protein